MPIPNGADVRFAVPPADITFEVAPASLAFTGSRGNDMATGAAWNIEEEAPDVPKPWANFDADAVVDIPIDWTAWLEDKETGYASHVITTHADLECPSSSESAGVVKARVRKNPAGAALVIGTKYWVRCHIVAADGQEDEQTLYLKVVAK